MSRKRNWMNSIPMLRPRRNTFDLSHDFKFDGQFGLLTPVFVADVLPGDSFKVQDELLVRFDALIAPILHNVNVFVHYFFVPNRLLWDDWEEFITGGPDGTSELVKPCFDPGATGNEADAADYLKVHGLYDYMGVQPLDTSTGVPQGADPIDLMPIKAYCKIWNDYYRDQNLSDEVDIHTEQSGLIDFDDPDDKDLMDDLTKLRYRAWEKDYFTSALPWTQRGAQMSIPFNLSPSPVSGEFRMEPTYGLNTPANWDVIAHGGNLPSMQSFSRDTSVSPIDVTLGANSYAGFGLKVTSAGSYSPSGAHSNPWPNTGIPRDRTDGGPSIDFSWVDATGVDHPYWKAYNPTSGGPLNPLHAQNTISGAPTINDLRVALRIQEWMETNAVGGSRYIEQIFAHFGVRSSDARLQRAEYLGGGRVPVVISEIEQTSATDQTSPQGHLAGQAISVGKTIKFKRYFEEHGWILGIMSIMPRASYTQGVPRMFTRQTKFDYFWPKFAHLGEQPIYNQELYLAQSGTPKGTFGYTPRYAEYRFLPSRVSGSLRSSKSFWHLSRIFANEPKLNESFVYLDSTSAAALDRIFAVTGDWPMTVEIFHRCWAKRPIPRFGTPTL